MGNGHSLEDHEDQRGWITCLGLQKARSSAEDAPEHRKVC